MIGGITDIQQAALIYALKYNFSVIPLIPSGKIPLTKHGFKDGTRDPEVIKEWFSKTPKANLGIVTGELSGLTVIDVDGLPGKESIKKLLPPSYKKNNFPVAVTGKGFHLYFQYDKSLKTAVGVLPGIDVRSDAGFVVAPPSQHENGSFYIWKDPKTELSLPEIPDWLKLAIVNDNRTQVSFSKPSWRSLEGEKILPGQRNTTLTSMSGHLISKKIDLVLGLNLVLDFNNAHCDPPLPRQEVERLFLSIARKESQNESKLK